MKKIIQTLVLFFIVNYLHAQRWDTIVKDNFNGNRKFIDNSLVLLWGTNTNPLSAFNIVNKSDKNGLTFKSIERNPTSKNYGGYTGYPQLMTTTSIDYEFNGNIDRELDTIQVEFDLQYDTIIKNGEEARINVTLLHEYPSGGAKFGVIDSFKRDSILKRSSFGRPAYNFRIKNTSTSVGGSTMGMMLYGGGKNELGEFEAYRSAGKSYWIPGFSSTAGGCSPGSNGMCMGVNNLGAIQYPVGPCWTKNTDIAAKDIWKHYTWKIYPERLEVYWRNSSDVSSANQLIMFMQIPKQTKSKAKIISEMNAAHGTSTDSLPYLYHWFRNVNAIRFYSRWAYADKRSDFWIANIKVLKTKNAIISNVNKSIDNLILTFYPNPATDILHIKSSTIIGDYNISIYDITGKIVFMKRGTTDYLIESINVSTLKQGLYLVEVKSKDKRFTKRIVIK